MNDLPDIPDLPPGPWPLIGEGLWSSIHDLGDGTVLKLVRRHAGGTGGLGSGVALHRREVLALTLLGGEENDFFRVPALIGEGAFDSGAHAGWLRMSHLPGTAPDAGRILYAPPETRDAFGERLGATIAEFHIAATAHAHAAGSKLGDSIARSITLARDRFGQPDDHRAADTVLAAWAGECEAGPLVFVHGDVNLSNVMDPGPRAAPGLVDFAEAGFSLAEADFRHMDGWGPLRDAVFRGYAARSGHAPDMRRVHLASAANALCTIAIEGGSGHPREAMRRRGQLEHCLEAAGLS
ncbi:MAG: aminoglycoside phosphotransferase family protein [Hydrogenophaga sp.]|nr:aminoglycoside phosphotransferase family protein [Hydrogenophaga sp.]